MSERNKRFRSHCNIDVLLNKKDNTVSVDVSYKKELFSTPLSLKRYRYFESDVVEELVRQGIVVDKDATSNLGSLDNTSKHEERHRLSAVLSLAPSVNKTKEKESDTVVEPVKKTTKRSRTKAISTDE